MIMILPYPIAFDADVQYLIDVSEKPVPVIWSGRGSKRAERASDRYYGV